MKLPPLRMRHSARKVNHGGMTDPELIRRAEAAGITTSYENWQRQRVDVPPETLEAILAALAQSSCQPDRPDRPDRPSRPGRPSRPSRSQG